MVNWQPSSPHYPKSNGHAEAAVKSVKAMVSKLTKNGALDLEEFEKALIEFRNSPRSDGRSPAEVLFGYPIRTPCVPTHHSVFAKRWQEKNEELDIKIHQERDKIKEKYDKQAKDLSRLHFGQWVNAQNPKTKRWDRTGTIVAINGKRSYVVKLPSGRTLCRNRRMLRQHHPLISGGYPG
jgi:hypothetical protein